MVLVQEGRGRLGQGASDLRRLDHRQSDRLLRTLPVLRQPATGRRSALHRLLQHLLLLHQLLPVVLQRLVPGDRISFRQLLLEEDAILFLIGNNLWHFAGKSETHHLIRCGKAGLVSRLVVIYHELIGIEGQAMHEVIIAESRMHLSVIWRPLDETLAVA